MARSALRQAIGVLDVMVGGGDADRGADVDLAALELEGVAQRLQDPVGDGGAVALRRLVRDEDGKLVPTQSRDGVDRPHARAQALGDLDQEHVAGRMAERVVDLLEAVQVEEEDGQLRGPVVVLAELVLHARPKERAVREPRERVVGRLVHELGLEPLALADIARVQHDPADCRVVDLMTNEKTVDIRDL